MNILRATAETKIRSRLLILGRKFKAFSRETCHKQKNQA